MELAPNNLTILDGKDAVINCRVAGAPTPNVTWIYQGIYRYLPQNTPFFCNLL